MRMPLCVLHKGRTGNRLFQYFFCEELARRSGSFYVADVHIPDFGITTESGPAERDGFLCIEGWHEFDIEGIAAELRSGKYAGATFSGYAQRLEYYDRDHCKHLLNLKGADSQGFGPEFLVINIRAGDIFQGLSPELRSAGYGRPYGASDLYDGIHPDYRPLPVSFYEKLVRETGLKPVFVGETASNRAYEMALRRRFPTAVFTGTRTPREDFLTIMGSTHLVMAISTFSWLAAWFSEARSVHIPMGGFLDPRQRPDVNLLPPASDTRYIRHPLPRFQWRGTPDQVAELFS